MQLRFTTYVVITMKSPHLLSTVHDLAICTRSAQSSQKDDFITTTQTAVSQFLHQRYVQLSILGQAFPLLHERGHVATPAPVSPASSWTHLLTRHRTRLHDLRLVVHVCMIHALRSPRLGHLHRLATDFPHRHQLSRQIQESATSVRHHVHAG